MKNTYNNIDDKNTIAFISDLHLQESLPHITNKFYKFMSWAKNNVKTLYILGDFFHAWAGDDVMDAWSISIASRLAWLANSGVKIYWMAGNRDFLLGTKFCKLAHITLLTDPSIININNKCILLSHGDMFCSHDTTHQWFRTITQNFIFKKIFLSIPSIIRKKMVSKVRYHSSIKHKNMPNEQSIKKTMIVPETLHKILSKFNVDTIIHGHIHRPGKFIVHEANKAYTEYVLSDWDNEVEFLCYNGERELYFNKL